MQQTSDEWDFHSSDTETDVQSVCQNVNASNTNGGHGYAVRPMAMKLRVGNDADSAEQVDEYSREIRPYAEESRQYIDEPRPVAGSRSYPAEPRPLSEGSRPYSAEPMKQFEGFRPYVAEPKPGVGSRPYSAEARPRSGPYFDEARPRSRPYSDEAKPRSRPYSDEAGPRSGPYSDQAGSRSRPYYDEAGPRSRPHSDQAGPRSRPYSAEAGPRSRPYSDEAGPRSRPDYDEAGPRSRPYSAEARPRSRPYSDEAGPRSRPYYDEAGPRSRPYSDEAGPRSRPYSDEAGPRSRPYFDEAGPTAGSRPYSGRSRPNVHEHDEGSVPQLTESRSNPRKPTQPMQENQGEYSRPHSTDPRPVSARIQQSSPARSHTSGPSSASLTHASPQPGNTRITPYPLSSRTMLTLSRLDAAVGCHNPSLELEGRDSIAMENLGTRRRHSHDSGARQPSATASSRDTSFTRSAVTESIARGDKPKPKKRENVEDAERHIGVPAKQQRIRKLMYVLPVLLLLVLFLILMPVSFVYVDYDKMALIRTRSTGAVDKNVTYYPGCYLLGPDSEFIHFKLIGHWLMKDNFSVFSRSQLEIGLNLKLMYFIRSEQLGQMYAKYADGYEDIIDSAATDALKNTAVQFSLDDYRLQRPLVEEALYNRTNEELKGFFVDLKFLWLESVSFSSLVADKLMNSLILQVKAETERHKLEAAAVDITTSKYTAAIKNRANELLQGAQSYSSFIRARAAAEADRITQMAEISGWKRMCATLGIAREDLKMSLLYVSSLDKMDNLYWAASDQGRNFTHSFYTG